jgi:hypothetical protein
MARRSWGATLALTLLAATVACGKAAAPGGGEVVADQPPVWVEPGCPTPRSTGMMVPLEMQQRGGIPDDFVPTGVLRCRRESREMAGQVTLDMQVLERADTGAAELVERLRRPSDPPSDGVCDASMVHPPYFLLVDAAGRALVPAVPTDGCGKPRQEIADLLESLPYHRVSETQLGQGRSARPDENGCPDRFKDLIAIDPIPRSQPAPASPLWPGAEGDLRACVYERVASPDQTPTGTLTVGFPISGDAAATLRAALDNAGPAAACAAEHSKFAVLTVGGKANWATVELDGCLRVLRPDNTFGQLDAATVALISIG